MYGLLFMSYSQDTRDFGREMNDPDTICTARFCVQNIV